jgi:hypothetical protein
MARRFLVQLLSIPFVATAAHRGFDDDADDTSISTTCMWQILQDTGIQQTRATNFDASSSCCSWYHYISMTYNDLLSVLAVPIIFDGDVDACKALLPYKTETIFAFPVVSTVNNDDEEDESHSYV